MNAAADCSPVMKSCSQDVTTTMPLTGNTRPLTEALINFQITGGGRVAVNGKPRRQSIFMMLKIKRRSVRCRADVLTVDEENTRDTQGKRRLGAALPLCALGKSHLILLRLLARLKRNRNLASSTHVLTSSRAESLGRELEWAKHLGLQQAQFPGGNRNPERGTSCNLDTPVRAGSSVWSLLTT